jgi:hypothetical protein
MIYQMVLASLGPHGRWLLELIQNNQLLFISLGLFLIFIEKVKFNKS